MGDGTIADAGMFARVSQTARVAIPPQMHDDVITPEVMPPQADPATTSSAPNVVPAGGPPTTYAIVDFLDGADGSVVRLAGLTLVRTVAIIPGIWVASKVTKIPLTFGQLCGFGLASSASITGGMTAWYALKRRRAMRAA